ncbi:hypothetical protein B0T25DRAFT_457784 [Lasiosphaeria hispida]|uniref:Impact N-terminal domain-containing protein n=1 Tax=Lasiosphaeria hispida TaxID=260671 RepID=A0AAJ0MCV2_9PEZI|nr:hypothetical protein B0T25DRAFT_457784 [Lasiosphaeria hispida]
MATQQDLQELLRLLTVSRKIPMMQAMAHIKALQAVDLRSIKQIAESDLPTVESAIKDSKAAKMLQSACKAVMKRVDVGGSNKRTAPSASPTSAKRARSDVNPFMGGPSEMSPQELERSLDLPVCMDEERIAETVLQTNRAPLVLAFAVELLRHTMPEQPPSSRLSLGQAVVSANSRSKAPRVRVMGREVAVLKRGDYEWRGDETVSAEQDDSETKPQSQTANIQTTSTTATLSSTPLKTTWTASQPFSLKKSTFIARAAPITSVSEQKTLLASLLAANPSLQTATHNAWAYRLRPPEGAGIFGSTGRVREASFDDGETGCGDLMLRVMREAGAVDTMVVLTRWFGGVFLGPDRWRLMRNCVSGALSERLRRSGAEVVLGGEAVWGLDLEAARAKATVGGYGSGMNERLAQGVGGMQVHRPEAARKYLLRSFATAETAGDGEEKAKKKKTIKEMEAEKEANSALVLGALRIVLDSWADHLAPAELDRRAWSWYTTVRPEVEGGPAGWGAKSILRLSEILKLKRKE